MCIRDSFGVEPAIAGNGEEIGCAGIHIDIADTIEIRFPDIPDIQAFQLQVRAVFYIAVRDKHITFVARNGFRPLCLGGIGFCPAGIIGFTGDICLLYTSKPHVAW